VPGRSALLAGGLVTLDVAAELAGYHAGAAITVPVQRVDAVDGAPSAHEEHTVLVAERGPVILTAA
jgi:methionine aminopeptidase